MLNNIPLVYRRRGSCCCLFYRVLFFVILLDIFDTIIDLIDRIDMMAIASLTYQRKVMQLLLLSPHNDEPYIVVFCLTMAVIADRPTPSCKNRFSKLQGIVYSLFFI